MSLQKRWQDEFWRSIKGFDTEEKLDLYFYRPFGFLIAKIALVIGLTPTMLTVVGLVLGIASGFLFFHNESNHNLILASCLLILSGVFDSSDGQLARMGGKSTKLGLVLDGLCDNLVFASAYIGSFLTVMPIWGPWIIPIALFAGFCHSLQSSVLDFFNRDYLYLGYGKVRDDYWNPTLTEARTEKAAASTSEEKLFWFLRFTWVWQQNKFCGRGENLRHAWKRHCQGIRGEEFQSLYREHNRVILRFWRLMGANFHTMMILLFVFLRRFDFYLIGVDIFALTLALFILRAWQMRRDAALDQILRARGFV